MLVTEDHTGMFSTCCGPFVSQQEVVRNVVSEDRSPLGGGKSNLIVVWKTLSGAPSPLRREDIEAICAEES
jgi:hypothetical protein